MSTNTNNASDNQEIDLSALSKRAGNLFQDFSAMIFRGIRFFVKNVIIISILVILGFGLGFYLDRTNKVYHNNIIVSPNFSSVDYLYLKISLLNSKIKEKDTVFLKSIGIAEPKKISLIEIEPVVDVYTFINHSDKNFEILKLMAEDGDIQKIVKQYTTSKNYPSHIIHFKMSKLTTNEQTVNPIMNYLNDSDFYRKIQKEYQQNIQIKINANDSIIKQIDGFLNEFSKTVTNGSAKNDKLVYYNENTQLNDVIKTKEQLINEQGDHRIALVSLDKIVKDNSTTINIESTEIVNGNMKFLLPFLFIILFIGFNIFRNFYKHQSLKEKIQQ